MEPRYDIKEVEEKIYRLWEGSGFFDPDKLPEAKKRKPFTIIMPPNNANGLLHMGHAVGLTLQDILIRFWRMRGKKTLWLPGADHAGFETQVVYDKKLDREGRNRYEMSREQLWKEIWDFTEESKAKMYAQTKKLGASCDWSRETFTLDPKIIETVYETFEKLYEDGLVYRDLKVVSWCPKHRTALSDLEVKHVEREDPLYYVKYGPLTLATVRPETKFGDTALAVNPKDSRYKKYIGREIEAKGILGNLKFRVVGDEAVDPKFGTGVIKVTPAHDQTDFEIWTRHKEEIAGPKIIIDETGRLTGEVGEFKGLKVAEAREKVAEKMKEIGILEKVEPNYKHQVATCYKCGSTLEPLPRPQWFVKMKPLAEPAIKAVKTGKVKIHPKRSEKVYLHWLKNIRDWNISRQIVWGIRIPAWFCLGCGEAKINTEIRSRWFLVRHGETDFNKEKRTMSHGPISINDLGRSQAKLAALSLKNRNIDLIISSDLKRCVDTAKIISDELGGVEVIYEKGLRERDFGVLEGKTYEEGHREFGEDVVKSYDGEIPGAETMREVEKRAWEAFISHRSKHSHRNVVVVSHGGVIRMLRKKIKNLGVEDAFKVPGAKNAEIVPLEIGEKCKKCSGDLYEQDPDVFDTWFSSGQWPFATLMKNQKDFKAFYPTEVMETGYDILFFWVARMIMLGLYRTGKTPFKDVYLHGLVRDKDRQKMSKSKGNVVDPLGVADTYGTDAVRMALVIGNTAGNDIVISEDKIRGYRNFATKIWNVARFVLLSKKSEFAKIKVVYSPADKKDLVGLKKVKVQVTKHIEKYEFHLAGEKIYHYFWHTFADKIVETSKPRLNGENLKDAAAAFLKLETILKTSLKMLHPFMPYITEEIYSRFEPDKMLMVEKWD
ncbi:MAG: class I tRNA ligase family protein [Patescibacteria group bacterium]